MKWVGLSALPILVPAKGWGRLSVEEWGKAGAGGSRKQSGSVLVERLRGVEFAFAYVAPGTWFRSEDAEADDGAFMGAEREDSWGRGIHSVPFYPVTLTRGFFMQTTTVTHGQWKAVMGGKRRNACGRGDDLPVEHASWNDAQEFIRRLNRTAGWKRYRLPTEAEWEYACRAGSTTRYCCGNDEERLHEYAWYKENSGGRAHPVGAKKPNAWGLYDMHGHVHEWCLDWFEPYPSGATTDSVGPARGSFKIQRGGNRFWSAPYCRSGQRWAATPNDTVGFRLAREDAPVGTGA